MRGLGRQDLGATGSSRCSSACERCDPAGHATTVQGGIDTTARDHGVTLQWCIGTPADFAQTTNFTQVTSGEDQRRPRVSRDRRAALAWFCTTSALARSLT